MPGPISRRALLASALATPALAQGFPGGRPVRITVPFPAGGSTDVIARTLADRLRAAWGSPVVIENRPGGGGSIGAEAVARAAADGTELLLASVSISTNHHLVPNLPFDPFRDFAPVGLVATVPNAVLATKALPADDIAGLIALARARPGQLTYGSAGIGTSAHLATELFCRMAGVRMEHVPYRGTGPALNDLVAGRLDLMFDILTAAMPQIAGGSVRALAITTAERSPVLPDLPPVAATLPGFEASTWNAMFAPARTPPEVVAQLSADIAAALRTPEVTQRFAPLGVTALGSTPAALAEHLAAESERWGRLIREAGIKG